MTKWGEGTAGDALADRPAEDRGHDTALWYAYQYCCTVQECLRMLVEPIPWVLCEWHTDFICGAVVEQSDGHCLVSVKHRRPDQGAWPLAELGGRAGLSTLFARWDQSGGQHSCRLMTNGGFKSGKEQAGALLKLLDGGPKAPEFDSGIDIYAKELHDALDADADLSSIKDFLRALKLVTTAADEFSMRAYVIEEVARPILRTLGVDPMHARNTFKSALELVYEAVLGLDPDNPPTQWLSGSAMVAGEQDSRRVTRERLTQNMAKNGVPISSEHSLDRAPGKTRMARKLRAGNLGPTVLGSAPRLRRKWYDLEVSYRSDLPNPIGDEVKRLRAEVASRAIQAENRTRLSGHSYGPSMHIELSQLLDDQGIKPLLPVSLPELIGCVYQLTDECEIWWSDYFDASEDAPWIIAEERGTK